LNHNTTILVINDPYAVDSSIDLIPHGRYCWAVLAYKNTRKEEVICTYDEKGKQKPVRLRDLQNTHELIQRIKSALSKENCYVKISYSS